MYDHLKSGMFGDIHPHCGEWYITIPPNQKQLEEAALEKRIKLLVESDYSDLPVFQNKFTEIQKKAWADYRQALRDVTEQQGFPWDVKWPEKPKN